MLPQANHVTRMPAGLRRTEQPRMTSGKWADCTLILPDGTPIVGYRSSNVWGYFYFLLDGAWLKGRLSEFERNGQICLSLRRN